MYITLQQRSELYCAHPAKIIQASDWTRATKIVQDYCYSVASAVCNYCASAINTRVAVFLLFTKSEKKVGKGR